MLSSVLVRGLRKSPKYARKYATSSDELPGIVGQRVFVGPNAVSSMKAASKYTHPLLVSDSGIVGIGVFKEFRNTYFKGSYFCTHVQPNPSVTDVLAIRDAYLLSEADGIVGASLNYASFAFSCLLSHSFGARHRGRNCGIHACPPHLPSSFQFLQTPTIPSRSHLTQTLLLVMTLSRATVHLLMIRLGWRWSNGCLSCRCVLACGWARQVRLGRSQYVSP